MATIRNFLDGGSICLFCKGKQNKGARKFVRHIFRQKSHLNEGSLSIKAMVRLAGEGTKCPPQRVNKIVIVSIKISAYRGRTAMVEVSAGRSWPKDEHLMDTFWVPEQAGPENGKIGKTF